MTRLMGVTPSPGGGGTSGLSRIDHTLAFDLRPGRRSGKVDL
jgi:hypothetical protein